MACILSMVFKLTIYWSIQHHLRKLHEILVNKNGKTESIPLTLDDLVFVTNGSITESSTYGDNDHPAPPTKALGGSWTLWKNLANQSPEFGRPEKFCDHIQIKVGSYLQQQQLIIKSNFLH